MNNESTAKLKNYRQSPRKVRLIADLVRGKTAEHAIALLNTLPKRGSEAMVKLILSAVANANMEPKELVISTIQVNSGIVFKRSMPRARGRAAPIRKKSSVITLGLSKRSAPSAPRASKKEKAPVAKLEANK